MPTSHVFLSILGGSWAQEDEDGAPPTNFLETCREHAKQFSVRLGGRGYDGLHVNSVSETDCWFNQMYPDTQRDGSANLAACKEFATKLWRARENELRTNSTEGYAKLCSDLYEQLSLKGSKPLTVAMAPNIWIPRTWWLGIVLLLIVGLFTVFVAFMQNDSTQTLVVEVSSAKGLWRAADPLASGAGDSYCILEILGKPSSRTTTKVIKRGAHPEWKEQLDLKGYKRGDTLEFTIMEHGPKNNNLLGSVLLQGNRFNFFGFEGELQLTDRSCEGGQSVGRPKAAGTLLVRIPPPDAKWALTTNQLH